MNQLCQNKHMIRFRRWSRKGYAMFYSLGKCVTIGNLKKGIADVSLGKQANVCTSFSVCLPVQEDKAEDKWDEGGNPSEYMLQIFLVQLPQKQVVDINLFFSLTQYIGLPKGCVMHLFGFFLSQFKQQNDAERNKEQSAGR